jgi:hypothetical protein
MIFPLPDRCITLARLAVAAVVGLLDRDDGQEATDEQVRRAVESVEDGGRP